MQRVPTPETTRPAAGAREASGGGDGGGTLRAFLTRHLGPSLKFLTVGGIVFFVDAALYNLLVFWSPTHGWGAGALLHHPILAKIISISFASVLTYLGNRLWTFSDRAVPHTARSVLAFVLVNVIASLLQLGCLAFSRYVLGLQSPLADNISGTLIGQVVSTAFRYVTYGRFVFPRTRDE